MLKDDALHIEWRFKSAKNAKRIGITRPGSLLRFDAEKFWCDRWLFETFTEKDMIRAARLVAARTNDSESRMLIIIRAASVCDEEGNISAGAFRYFCGLLRLPPDRYLHRLEIPFPRRFRWCFDEHTN